MTPAELATRMLQLDWSATSLQHQLAIAAAIATLTQQEPTMSAPNVLQFPAPRLALRHISLLHLDGRLFATAGFIGPDSAWSWIAETVAAELECSEEDVHCAESEDGDLVTADGLPVYRIVHGLVASAPGAPPAS